MSKVVALYICEVAGAPMQARTEVRVLAGSGLAGDRYATNRGAYSRAKRQAIRHVTLIAREAIAEANRALAQRGMAPFGAQETRRNIVTEGVDVNALIGREFYVGAVRMRGAEPTRPCQRPAALVRKSGFKQAFADRGGVRAEVLSDGVISVGDAVTPFRRRRRYAVS